MALSSTEKARAFRERMKAQGLTARTVYLPQGIATPTPEEMTAFLSWKAGQPQRLPATGEESGNGSTERLAVTGPKDTGGQLPLTKEGPERGERLAVTGRETPQDKPPQPAQEEPPTPPPKPDRKAWYAEAKAEMDRETRQEIKCVARDVDHNTDNGIIEGVCKAAAFLVRENDPAKARKLIEEQGITHDQAEAILYPDHRRKMSIVLVALEKAGVWDKA